MGETNPFEPFFAEIRKIVREEIGKALSERKPAKLQFTTSETAEMLNVPESWLAAKARAKEIPHQQMGHYRVFSLRDIEKIMAQYSVGNGPICVIYSPHDGKEIQADSNAARVESVSAREALGGVAEHGGALGQGRQADSGPGRTRNETPSRKKRERGKIDGNKD
jgi:hypothetical protein